MGWSTGGDFGQPTLSTYEEALKHHNSITPVRGSDIRPIGERRKLHGNIRLGRDNTVIVRLYNTDVATYHQDGRIVIRPYGSRMTAEFLHRLLPVYVRLSRNNLWAGINGVAFLMGSDFTLKQTPSGWICCGFMPEIKQVLNRERATAARAKIAPALKYIRAKLHTFTPSKELQMVAHAQTILQRYHMGDDLLVWLESDEQADWDQVVTAAAAWCTECVWSVVPHAGSSGWDNHVTYSFNFDPVVKKCYDTLYRLGDCYDRVEVYAYKPTI